MAARGHQPTFIITPHYGRLVEQRGFPWIPVGTEEEFVRFARDPRVWHRMQGTKMVVQGMVETLPAYREATGKAGRDFDLVVLSSMALGAASVAEAVGIPRLTLHMQPALFRSAYECPVFMEELAWLTRSPRWVKRVFFAMVDILFWEAARKPLNAFRRELNLPPLRNFFNEAFHGAEGVAALFPDWFAARQPDWPPRVRQFSFPVTIHPHPLPESLETFLTSGAPPVAWTHGSANFDIQHFQSRALAVSRELKVRCLLVSLDPPDTRISRRRLPCYARALRGPLPAVPCRRTSRGDRNHRKMHRRGRAAACHPAFARPTRQCKPDCRAGPWEDSLLPQDQYQQTSCRPWHSCSN